MYTCYVFNILLYSQALGKYTKYHICPNFALLYALHKYMQLPQMSSLSGAVQRTSWCHSCSAKHFVILQWCHAHTYLHVFHVFINFHQNEKSLPLRPMGLRASLRPPLRCLRFRILVTSSMIFLIGVPPKIVQFSTMEFV